MSTRSLSGSPSAVANHQLRLAKVPIGIFLCYAHYDEIYLKAFMRHLAPLRLRGLADIWFDQRISPGQNPDQAIDKRIHKADIILLLLTSSFLDSDYCMNIETKIALERHRGGKSTVIPVIVKDCAWNKIPSLRSLQALPANANPVTSGRVWKTQNEAWLNVAEKIISMVEDALDAPS